MSFSINMAKLVMKAGLAGYELVNQQVLVTCPGW